MAVTWTTPTDISPGVTGSWQDADLSALIPAGSSGVIVRVVNEAASTANAAGLRKNGSTDDRRPLRRADSRSDWMIGVDGSRIVELYRGHTDVKFSLLGAFNSAMATFRTNGLDKSTSTTEAWVTTDISANLAGDAGIGVIVEFAIPSVVSYADIRGVGSTDDRTGFVSRDGKCAIAPMDSGKFQQKIGLDTTDLFVLGWLNKDVFLRLNALDRGPNVAGAFTDLAALPAGATGGIYDMTGSASAGAEFGIRKNGSAESVLRERMAGGHALAIAECDGSGLIEVRTGSTTLDAFQLGHFTEAAAADTDMPVISTIRGRPQTDFGGFWCFFDVQPNLTPFFSSLVRPTKPSKLREPQRVFSHVDLSEMHVVPPPPPSPDEIFQEGMLRGAALAREKKRREKERLRELEEKIEQLQRDIADMKRERAELMKTFEAAKTDLTIRETLDEKLRLLIRRERVAYNKHLEMLHEQEELKAMIRAKL